MKLSARIASFLLVLLYVAWLPGEIAAQEAPAPAAAPAPPEAVRGERFVELMQAGDFATLRRHFSVEMAAADARTDSVSKFWKGAVELQGGLTRSEHKGFRHHVTYTCTRGEQRKALKVNIDAAGNVIGLFYSRPGETEVPLGDALPGAATAFANGESFIENVKGARWEQARKDFSPELLEAVSADRLREIVKDLYLGEDTCPTLTRTDAGTRESLLLEFERAKYAMIVVRDGRSAIVGMFFEGFYGEPSYARPDEIREEEVVVGEAPWALPGTLTVPTKRPIRAAIVLVHGSGPNDRDETLAAAKPFRDLAMGLAPRGIAVLRYDKRTRVHGRKMKAWPTLDEETTDDAAAAVDLLAAREDIPSDAIYVLGHSMGGALIPRIAKKAPKAKGFVILAGSTRKLEDILLEQIPYIAASDGWVSDGERAHIERLKSQMQRVREGRFDESTPASELFGTPPARWLERGAYDPATAALGIRRPTLVLQGERDYQVTMVDYAGWQKTLGDKPWARFRSFPKLNHLFITGNGKSVPGEYDDPGNVDVDVLDEISTWIGGE